MTDSSQLHEQLVLLRAQVDYLLGRVADADGLGATPIPWTSLDRVQAGEEWSLLAGWVDWLTDRYGVTETVPPCWYDHPAILEELSALRAAWLGAYADPTARASDGVVWHDMLDRVLLRLREWDRTGCAGGTHRDTYPLPTDPGAVQDRCAFIRDDVAARTPPGCGGDAPAGPVLF